MLVYRKISWVRGPLHLRPDQRSRPTRPYLRWTRIGWGLVLLALLGRLGSDVPLRAQDPAPTTKKKAPAKSSSESRPAPEKVSLKTLFNRASAALESSPQQTIKLTDTIAEQIRQLRDQRPLTRAEGELYEDTLILKARALYAGNDTTGARRVMRLLLTFNPAFDRAVDFPEGAAWLEEIRQSEMGTVSLSSIQNGVAVKVNGRVIARIGNEPVQLSLFAGNYELTLEKADYLPKPIVFTLMAGETREYHDIQLKRGFFKVPIFVTDSDVEVSLNDEFRGSTKPFTEIMAKLDPTVRDNLLIFLENENINPSTISFFMVDKVPFSDKITFTFHKMCAVDETRTVELDEKLRVLLNENPVFPPRRSVCLVELESTAVDLAVDANLQGAEVFLDGELLGRTPMESTVCPGRHTLLVKHDGGRMRSNIVVSESEDLDIEVVLKPSLTFLGIYPSEFVNPEIHKEATRVLTNTLKSRVDLFSVEVTAAERLEQYFGEDSMSLGNFIGALSQPKPSVEELSKVTESLAKRLDTNLFLIGYFDVQEPSPTTVNLALFSKYHSYPDITRLDFRSPQDLTIFVNKFQVPEQIVDVFYEPWFGAKLVDMQFDDEIVPVVIDVQSGSPAKMAGLKPGDAVVQVDTQRRTTAEIIKYLGKKRQDAVVRLLVRAPDRSERGVQVSILRSLVEIPQNSRDILFNVYLAKLTHLLYEEGDDALMDLARFNRALVYLHFDDCDSALEILDDLTLEGTRGISQGTVLYYRGRCYERLGNKPKALAAYQEALTYEGSTVGSSEGPLVSTLAKERLSGLR